MALFAPEWGMVMVGRPANFRIHDVRRALRAAQAAGLPGVRVRTPDGVEYHIGGEVKGVPDPGPKSGDPVRDSASLAKGGKASMGDLGVRAFPLAKGGKTGMHGRGDRTVTAAEDSAGEQQPGSTAHKTSSRGSQLAEGGNARMFGKQAADTAPPGRTAKAKSVATPSEASGGVAWPAKPA